MTYHSDPYSYALYPAGDQHVFEAGDEIFVRQRGHGVVLRPSLPLEQREAQPAAEYPERALIMYRDDHSRYHVRPRRLAHVFGSHTVVICRKTTEYRTLARTQPRPGDNCIEVGCSYGEATSILAQVNPDVLGIDISEECVSRCREAYPDIQFTRLDCMQSPEDLVAAAVARQGGQQREAGRGGAGLQRRMVMFIDIGGNRALEAVVQLVPHLLQALSPDLVVVKSLQLHRAATRHLRSLPDGDATPAQASSKGVAVVHESEQWWGALRGQYGTLQHGGPQQVSSGAPPARGKRPHSAAISEAMAGLSVAGFGPPPPLPKRAAAGATLQMQAQVTICGVRVTRRVPQGEGAGHGDGRRNSLWLRGGYASSSAYVHRRGDERQLRYNSRQPRRDVRHALRNLPQMRMSLMGSGL